MTMLGAVGVRGRRVGGAGGRGQPAEEGAHRSGRLRPRNRCISCRREGVGGAHREGGHEEALC